MVRVLSGADPKVRRLRRTHPKLKGRKILGRGSFCQVFASEDPTRVLKLTADQIHVAYLVDPYSPRNETFKPRVFENHGVVGETSTGEDLYLLEVEKLNRMPRSGHVRRLMNEIMDCTAVDTQGVWRFRNVETLSAQDYPHLTPEIRDFMEEMNMFVGNFQCSLDLGVSNFMVRGDGTLVWSDPVFDKETHYKHQAKEAKNVRVINAVARNADVLGY